MNKQINTLRISGKIRLFSILALIAILNGYSSLTFAVRIIETTGTAAIIDGAQIIAKEQAIKNAMQQALLQNHAHIDSVSTISSSVLVIDSARINTSGTVENVKILEEWIEEEIFFVRIRATIPDPNMQTKQPYGSQYRKKIAVIQFDIAKRTQIYDIPDVERNWPRELILRLDNTGKFIITDATEYLVSQYNPGYKFDRPEVYQMIAKKTGAQFVISGLIRDISVEEGFFQDNRHLEIEIYIHDGLSGARISRHRFSETIADASYHKNANSLFSTANLSQSILGKALDRILSSQIELIQDDIRSIPFTARIIRLNGKQVYFDAGTTSQIRMGDVLMTYQLMQDPLNSLNNQSLGYIEQPIASLSVNQVQPQFSVGKLEIKNTKLKPGDIVRFGR